MSVPVQHATAVAAWVRGGWRGVLLRGPSGAGKSDLALRALAAGARLVADDRVILWRSGGRLFARGPEILGGLLEARSLGVRPVGALRSAEIVLTVDLVRERTELERTPDPEWAAICGVKVRRIALFPLESSAWAKLTLALRAATLGAGLEEAYQAPLANEAEAPGAPRGPLKRNR